MIDSHSKNEPGPTQTRNDTTDSIYVFEPATMRRQLMIDAFVRWMISFMAISCLLLAMTAQPSGATSLTLLALVAIATWFYIGTIGSHIAQQVPQTTLLIEQNPVAGETQLVQALGQRILPRSIRLLLYHRLAMLRYRQRRYEEVVIICQNLQNEMARSPQTPWMTARDKTGPMSGPVAGIRHEQLIRHHLLFMLVDASLQTRRLTDAYLALVGLHQCELRLADLLQLLLLQTRYEVAAGYATRSLQRIDQKVAMAELMPVAQCATMHALLAIGAHESGQSARYNWLISRADLFCEPDSWHAVSWVRLAPNLSTPLV